MVDECLTMVTLCLNDFPNKQGISNTLSPANIILGRIKEDQVAIDLVNILKGHRDDLNVENPADPISYEELLSYHLAFPPFFPNQKPFVSDDDFFVNSHLKYANPDADNIDSIIDRRRAWFEEEMEKKRERKITIKYYDASFWTELPVEGLSSLTPYATDTTTKINYQSSSGDFAGSGRGDFVGALFEGYLYVDPIIQTICVKSDDGSKLFLDDVLVIDNDKTHAPRRICAAVSEGVYKLDLEYFEHDRGATLILEWGPSQSNLRVVPPRSWASVREVALIPKILILPTFLSVFRHCGYLKFYCCLLSNSSTDRGGIESS